MNKLLPQVVNYYKNLIYQNRKWIYIILGIFGVGVFCGILVSSTIPSLTKLTLQEYSKILPKNLKGLNLSLQIFGHNFSTVFLTTISGIFLGIAPTLISFLNGLVLGMLVGFREIYRLVNPMQLVFLLFPHGIFEYAGTFLGLGFSLRLGLNWLLPHFRGKRLQILLQNLRETLSILVLVFGLLAMAALIEGMLTARIACFFTVICR